MLTLAIGDRPRTASGAVRLGEASGFTLIEVMVALAIAAMVMSVSITPMQRLYTSSQYRSAINDVVGLLSSARYTAVRAGSPQDVLIKPREREISAGNTKKILPDSVSLEVLGAAELNRDGAGVIRFYPDGGASGGYVNLAQANGNAVQVQVDWLLGRVSTCTENCEGLSR